MSRNNRWIFTTTEVVGVGFRMVNIIPPLVSMKSGQGKRECLLVEYVTCPCCMSHVIQAPRFSRALSEKKTNNNWIGCLKHKSSILYSPWNKYPLSIQFYKRFQTWYLHGYLTRKWCSAFQLYCRYLRPYIHNTTGKETQLYEMWTIYI